MSGEWGGLFLQVVVTIAVVLGLIAALYWVARRYSAGALGRLGRGRVPRLAVVDAAAVDGRRQLVLVRRDNVEHLILIGGPSDVIVEQGIQRRRRQPGEQPGTSADAATPPQPENPPIPFPQPARSAAANTQIFSAPARRVASAQSLFAAPRSEESESARTESALAATSEPAAATMAYPQQAEAVAGRASFGTATAPAAVPTPFAPPPRAETHTPSPQGGAMADLPSPVSEAPGDETAAKVNDLEREMARLLGEITAGKRP